MIREQYADIIIKLEQWRQERHLTQEIQLKGIWGNLFEELSEYERATNDNERLDALCDMAIFILNTIEVYYDELARKYVSKDIEIWLIAKFIATQLGLYSAFRHKEDWKNWVAWGCFKDALSGCFLIMDRMGYDPYLCMIETIKEISSRKGSYDESAKKWVKDTSDEAKAQWYKADYDKCKRSK